MIDNPYKHQGRQLAALRENKHLTQQQLATIIGVPAGRIGDWEQGRRPVSGVRFETAKRMADALGVSLSEFWDSVIGEECS